MTTPRILAIVLAGGNGTRLHPLTVDDSKPALPFARGYRIIDFVLSNLINSGIYDIHVVVQYKPRSLVEHLHAAWMPWFKRISIIHPPAKAGEGGFKGTADAVFQNLQLIEEVQPDLVAVFASDHVYRMDIRQMAKFHQQRQANVTIAAVPVPLSIASSFGIMATGPSGVLREFQEKPEQPLPIIGNPEYAYASMGNYLFDPDVLRELLLLAHVRGETDFGRHILPRLASNRMTYAYNFADNWIAGVEAYEEPHYWRDIGTLEALAQARQDVSGPRPRFNLANRHWPILSASPQPEVVSFVRPDVRPARTRRAMLQAR